MQTLNLNAAAELLKIHPQTVLERARSGDIPAAKPGKRWVFIEEDLINWLRSQYDIDQQDVAQGGEKQCSLKEKTVHFGGLHLQPQAEKEYANLLELPTKRKRRN
jgi:excisionase family DNA binding protein